MRGARARPLRALLVGGGGVGARGGARASSARGGALRRACLAAAGLLWLVLAAGFVGGGLLRAWRAEAELSAALLGALDAGGGVRTAHPLEVAPVLRPDCAGPTRSVRGAGEAPVRVVPPLQAAGAFPLARALEEVEAVGDAAWLHKKLPYQGNEERGWSALGLRTPYGDTGPGSVYYGRYRPSENLLEFRDTPASGLFPATAAWVRAALSDGPDSSLRGVRLLRLDGRLHLQPHWDPVVALGGTPEAPELFTQLRFIVLLTGAQTMCFSSGERGEEGGKGLGGAAGVADASRGCFEMEPGQIYYTNIEVKHEVFVTSDKDRVVLVVDTEPTDADLARVCAARPPPRAARPADFPAG